MAGAVALLLWALPLGLAGSQPPQLLVSPPWVPAALWDRVALTCRGSGGAGATSWHRDGQRWGHGGRDSVAVTKSGNYTCATPGGGRSPPVRVSDDWLVLQLPARPLLEGDAALLRCRGWKDASISGVSFYRDGEKLREPRGKGTELSLSPLQRHHGGRYRCEARLSLLWRRSEEVTVTVHELFSLPLLEAPPEPTEGSPLNLSCLSTPSPLRPRTPLLFLFHRDGELLGDPQGSPRLRLPAVELSHSGNYSCQVRSRDGAVRKSSARLRVSVRRVPLSGVSLWAQPPGARVALGDRLVLGCAVAEGTGPRSFWWHRHHPPGPPLATGPLLELPRVGDGDGGRYRCRVSDGDSVAESAAVDVTVLVPVANATISAVPGRPRALRCSVRAGSVPVTFRWLRDGREVARGPVLELGDIAGVARATVRCVATNGLGEGERREFRAESGEVELRGTAGGQRGGTALAAGVGGSLLALLLLAAAIAGWHRHRHRQPPRTTQDRAPPVSPERGEVLYAHVVPTGRAGGSPSATPEGHQVTYAELPGPRWHPGDSGDYENVL